MFKNKKGFTLIELLVVIAIIGILSSIVLASLNTARAKGSDAAIKSSINNMRAQAALFYDGTGAQSYGANGNCTTATMFTSTNADSLKVLLAGTTALGSTVTCNVAGTPAGSTYAISGTLKTTGLYYCVDSTGAATSSSGATIGTTNLCS